MRIERGADPGPFPAVGRYKPHLRRLFRERCAYCLTPDDRTGGLEGMQVDHFRPTSRYRDLRLAWSNLYYSCAVCNSHYKKDHPTEAEEAQGHRFVDPCEEDPDDHFRMIRDPRTGSFSRVGALTDPARYTLRILQFNARKFLRDFWRELDRLERNALSGIQDIECCLQRLQHRVEKRGSSEEDDDIQAGFFRQLQRQRGELADIRSRRPFPVEGPTANSHGA